MKTISRFGLGAVGLSLLAASCAVGALLERNIAYAERELAIGNFSAADRSYTAVWELLNRVQGALWVLPDLRNEIISRRAALRYWQADYASLVSQYANFDAGNNVALEMTVANAIYRVSQRPDSPISEMLSGLDQAIGRYTQLVQKDGETEDVAYNYEFLVRLRDELVAGVDWTPKGFENPLGQEGGVPLDDGTELDDVQIYVPLHQDDLDVIDEPTMGTDPPIRRRG